MRNIGTLLLMMGLSSSISFDAVAAPKARRDTTAPSVPQGLKATATGCAVIALDWVSSTDTGSGVKAYRVYRNATLLKEVAAPATNTLSQGLLESRSYTYNVSAVDNAGNES